MIKVCRHIHKEIIKGYFSVTTHCLECGLVEETTKRPEPVIIQKGKCTTCDYAKKNPTTILIRTEDWDILWERQGDYCKFCMNDVLMAQIMNGFSKMSGIPEEELDSDDAVITLTEKGKEFVRNNPEGGRG